MSRARDNADNIILTDDVDDTPVDTATEDPVSSNWAYDHENEIDAHGMLEEDNTFTGHQTFGEVTEGQHNLTGTVIDPANGKIQYKTLASNTTFTESFEDGQSVVLLIDDGSARTITWPTITWLTPLSGPEAPTLRTSGYTRIVLFQMSSTLYGSY